jgi:endonuclease III related protein
LNQQLGPQHWWPGESPFEVIVGAVLVQNTAWKNVQQAIENLRGENLLDPKRLDAVGPDALEELIRPAGYYRLKTKRLRNLLALIVQEYGGSIDLMRAAPSDLMREQLLSVSGIGPETADSILLYALDWPVMVVDTYTHRIFFRHGWTSAETDYHQLQDEILVRLPQDVSLYQQLHALLVNVGHHYCSKKKPKCGECPLQEMLPEGGMIEGD